MTSTLSAYELETLPVDFTVTDAFGRTWTKIGPDCDSSWRTGNGPDYLSPAMLAHFYGPLQVSPPSHTTGDTISSVEALQALLGGSAIIANNVVWLKTSETEDTWTNAWGIRGNSPAVFTDNPALLYAASNAGSQP